MSSEVKRYRMPVGVYMQKPSVYCDLNDEGEFVKHTDYESLRLSHEETKRQLRALEDAIDEATRTRKLIGEWGYIIDQAKQNSRARKQG